MDSAAQNLHIGLLVWVSSRSDKAFCWLSLCLGQARRLKTNAERV